MPLEAKLIVLLLLSRLPRKGEADFFQECPARWGESNIFLLNPVDIGGGV
jgi:hypothetical protein